jgi:hypothetical protein
LRLAAQHHCRRGERNQGTWDRAGEFTVTPILKNAKNDKGQDIFSLPKDALYSQQYENKEAEAIYKMLKEIEDQNQPPQNQPQQQPGPGQGSGKGKGKGKPQPGNDPGQGPPQPDPAGGEVRDLPGKDGQAATEAEKEQGRQDWKIATQQAAKIAKSCGKLPGELLRLVDDILEPVIDWKEALRQFVDRVSRNDYSWRRPNSRYMAQGVILPTLYNQELPPMIGAIDLSGSVSQEEANQELTEFDDILNQYPTDLTILPFNTQVKTADIKTFTREDRPLRMEVKAGGGTAYSPIFKWINENMSDPPCCVIILTDMECQDFGPEPEYPVFWINTGKRCKQPPFGEMIRFKNDNH